MRPQARPPKGFRDYFGSEVVDRNAMLEAVTGIYHRYGFDPLESPAVETVEALGKFLPDVDRPNEGVFAWKEDEAGWIALRYDLTAPLARVYAQFRNDLPLPYRRYAVGPVWRNEKPGPGRFRQFFQCDADTVGSGSPAADAEMCMMLADILEAVGIRRGEYIVRLNSRTVLDGIMNKAGILDPDRPEAAAQRRATVMRAIDKLDRLGADGVLALLGTGRRDESGDYTPGAGLAENEARVVMDLIAPADGRGDGAGRVRAALSDGDAGGRDVLEIEKLVRDQGYGPDRIMIDTSVVRGLGYYTGPVYEAELTIMAADARGRPQQFGSVAGGGRYDGLVRRFTGQDVPATGVSLGVDRLLSALRAGGRAAQGAAEAGSGPVVVTVMDRDRLGDYQAMAAELRSAGIRAEVYLGNPKNFGNQLRYADRRNSPVAVIEGSEERSRGVVLVKDLVAGRQIAEVIDTSAEWKSQPAQFEVRRDGFVPEVLRLVDAFRLPPEELQAELARRRDFYLGRL